MKLADYYNEKSDVRVAFGNAMKEYAAVNSETMLMTDDLRAAIKCEPFIKAYPERFVECGIAEAGMMGMAAGLASCGKIPFAVAYATFATWRVAEQLRNDVAYTNFPVKVVSMTTGVQFGQGGMSHQTYGDVTLTRMLPNFTVLVPADAAATAETVKVAAEHNGPVFLRLGRDAEYHVYAPGECKLRVGGSNLLRDGTDIALIAAGFMVREALIAAELLEKKGFSVSVVDMYSIKPIDKERLFSLADSCKAFMTVEEHWTSGLGGAVMEAFSGRRMPPVLLHGLQDSFPPIGPKFELRALLGLDAKTIAEKAEAFLNKL